MKKVIFTFIIDGYDTLKDPTVVTPGWDYLCFSDEGLGSSIWQPISSNGRPPGVTCPKRRASLLKIEHHRTLAEGYDLCISLDGSMRINVDLDAFLSEFWAPGTDMAIARHPHRDCIYDEGLEVLELKMDDPRVVDDQLRRYEADQFPRHQGLYGTRAMVKDMHSERLRRACDRWSSEYRAGSRRDQLSLNYALWREERETGDPLRLRVFDFNEVYRLRKLFEITPHLGSNRWR
jgi:hypothetical protein